jgi:hypothetical protein
MTVSPLNVLLSGRPDRFPAPSADPFTAGGQLAVALLVACLPAGRPAGRR